MSEGVETRTIPVGDGRELCVELAGDPQGRPILVHNGTPNSRHLYGEWIADADNKGIRLISYDRPGYGGSTVYPGHTVASAADDVRVIAEVLGYDRLGVWGISGGGPCALACAAQLPDLAVAVGVVASPAPYGVDESFDYYAGMGELNAEGMKLFFSDREAARRQHHEDWKEALATSPEQLAESIKTLLSSVDVQALTSELAQFFASCSSEGLAAGEEGWWDDGASVLIDWGFDLQDIRLPVKLWHGRQDRFVPVQHGEWLAAHVPGVEAEITDHDGHLTMMTRVGEFHDWLLEHF